MSYWVNTDTYDEGEYTDYQEALAADVRAHRDSRYARVREEDLPKTRELPKPEALTSNGYDHYMAFVGDVFNQLCDMSRPLPDRLKVSYFNPGQRATDPGAMSITLWPSKRIPRSGGLKKSDKIYDIYCTGMFLGEQKSHTILLSLYPSYVKAAIIRDDKHRRSYPNA